jgi:hypothetical protein
MCKLYNHISVKFLEKSINVVCYSFPKIVLRVLNFCDSHPFTLAPTNTTYFIARWTPVSSWTLTQWRGTRRPDP